MSGYDKTLEKWALARGIGYPRSCQECPERKKGCYLNCRFIKAHIEDIGKTVFLTKEQAEKALAEIERLKEMTEEAEL